MIGFIYAMVTTLALSSTTVPTQQNEPIIVEQTIEEVQMETEELPFEYEIYSCTTTYTQTSNDANRNFNIKLASEAINNLILAPGKEFSFNDTILENRNSENDYKEAGAFLNGQVINAVGGGICQVSSTLYNCALYSNMDITQRQSHSMKVGYLPLGMDATVSWGAIDFAFKNQLSIPIKIYAYANDGKLTVKILGQSNPNLENVRVVTTEQNNVYYTSRYIDDIINYSTKSVYKN